jgi:hypothetical protein
MPPVQKEQKANGLCARRTPAFDARNAVDETRAKPLCIYRFDQGHSRGVSAQNGFPRVVYKGLPTWPSWPSTSHPLGVLIV